MAKKNDSKLTLQGYEQSTLRVLLALREQANASVAAASGSVRNYLIQLLQGRGLDPQKWGISPDMAEFVEIQPQAAPPVAPADSLPAGTPGAPAPFASPATPTPASAAAAAPAQP